MCDKSPEIRHYHTFVLQKEHFYMSLQFNHGGKISDFL